MVLGYMIIAVVVLVLVVFPLFTVYNFCAMCGSST